MLLGRRGVLPGFKVLVNLFNDTLGILRLRQIEITAHSLSFTIVLVLIERREKKDDNVFESRIAFHPLAYIKPRLAAQDHIKDNEIGLFLLNKLHCLVGRDCFENLEAVQFQEEPQNLADSRLIIYQQNAIPFRHVAFSYGTIPHSIGVSPPRRCVADTETTLKDTYFIAVHAIGSAAEQVEMSHSCVPGP